METRQEQTQVEKGIEVIALGDYKDALVGDACKISLDKTGCLVLHAAVIKDYRLSVDGYHSGDADRWSASFIRELKALTGHSPSFRPTENLISLPQCQIQLPFEDSQTFEIKFKSSTDKSDILTCANTKQAIAILEKYLQTFAQTMHKTTLTGDFKLPTKLDLVGDYVFEQVSTAGREIAADVKSAVAHVAKTPFGKGVLSALDKLKLPDLNDRFIGKKVSLESMAYNHPDTITFDSIFGQKRAVAEFSELSEILASPKATPQEKRAATPGLLVLTGGTGVGKTRTMHAFIQSTNTPAYILSADTLMTAAYGGVENLTGQLMRELRTAAQNSPTGVVILMVDEGESKLGGRGADSHEASKRMLAMFLENIQPNTGVLVMIGTNLPFNLDAAMISRTVKEVKYKPLSGQSIAEGLLYQVDRLPLNNEYKPSSKIKVSDISSMFEDVDGRIIDHIITRLNGQAILHRTRSTKGEFKITPTVLKNAITWATDADNHTEDA